MLSPLLLDVGGHQLEAAETILQVGRSLVIVLAAQAMAEVMVRLQLPTFLGELVAGGSFSLEPVLKLLLAAAVFVVVSLVLGRTAAPNPPTGWWWGWAGCPAARWP